MRKVVGPNLIEGIGLRKICWFIELRKFFYHQLIEVQLGTLNGKVHLMNMRHPFTIQVDVVFYPSFYQGRLKEMRVGLR